MWARENTREALFDAMKRKEVYATTGTRLAVRVFGGWDFEADRSRRGPISRAPRATGAVCPWEAICSGTPPMAEAPSFMIRALRDPDGANLDRVQIIKGWLDKEGELHERIYDVAVSDGRKIDSDGRAKRKWATLLTLQQQRTPTRSVMHFG